MNEELQNLLKQIMRILTLRRRPRKVILFMSLHNKTNVNFSTLGLMYTKSDCPHKKYAWWSILIWIWLRTKLARRYSIIAVSTSDFLATCVEPCYKCQVIQNAAMAQLHPYVCHQGQESANVLCPNHQSCRKASRTLTSSDLRTEHFGSEMQKSLKNICEVIHTIFHTIFLWSS